MEKILSSQYKVRFNDCDLFGHLNNSRYLDYFMNAREDQLKQFYDLDYMMYYQQNLSWLISSHEIIYLRPAMYNEQVEIRSALLRFTNFTLDVELVMLDATGEHIKALLWTRFTMINVKTGRKENQPEDFIALISQVVLDKEIIEAGIHERAKQLRNEFRHPQDKSTR